MAKKKKAPKPKKAAKQADTIRNLWTHSAPPIRLGRESFRFMLHRPRRKLPTVNIDDLVADCDWERQGNQRTATLNFMRPLSAGAAQIMAHGDEIQCDVAEWDSTAFKSVWRMQIDTPEEQLQAGTISLALTSQLDAATKSKGSFKF